VTKIQSMLLFCFFLLNLNSFAAQVAANYLPGLQSYSVEQTEDEIEFNDQQPVSIQGKWTMVSRRCLSGAPVLDRYIPGRDIVEINFEERNYHSHSRINGCDYWSSGKYRLTETNVYYSNIRGASNCGPVNVRSHDQNRYVKTLENEIKFFSGPFVVGPAPCPMGDILEFTYKK